MAIPNEPLTRTEQFLNRIATGEGTIPDEPLTRVEQYLDEIAKNGGSGGGTGLSDDAKAALLACFRNVAWIGSDGQDYYNDLYDALYPPAPPASLLSITAAFNQGSAVIYDTDTLNSLKQYLTVTAHYDDASSQVVTNYTLSGTLTEGTSTITVSYGGKTTTFNVTVSHVYETVYALHQSAGSTGKLILPEAFKTIELTMDMPTPATSVKVLLVVSGTRPWFGTQNSQWKYEGDALDFTASKTFSEAVNQGKQTVVFDFASATLIAIGYDSGTYSPEVTWYRVRTFDGDTVTHDLKPTATVGDMYDSITGTTFSFSNTTNMEVIEVTT